jgi:hypothetical protein
MQCLIKEAYLLQILWIRNDNSKFKREFSTNPKISLILPSLTWQDRTNVQYRDIALKKYFPYGIRYQYNTQSIVQFFETVNSLTEKLFPNPEKLWPEHIEGRIEEQVEAAGGVQVSIPVPKKKNYNQCSESVTFQYGSESVDLYHWLRIRLRIRISHISSVANKMKIKTK